MSDIIYQGKAIELYTDAYEFERALWGFQSPPFSHITLSVRTRRMNCVEQLDTGDGKFHWAHGKNRSNHLPIDTRHCWIYNEFSTNVRDLSSYPIIFQGLSEHFFLSNVPNECSNIAEILVTSLHNFSKRYHLYRLRRGSHSAVRLISINRKYITIQDDSNANHHRPNLAWCMLGYFWRSDIEIFYVLALLILRGLLHYILHLSSHVH